jgi:hypothetical protein
MQSSSGKGEVRQQYWQVADALRKAPGQHKFLQGRIGWEKKKVYVSSLQEGEMGGDEDLPKGCCSWCAFTAGFPQRDHNSYMSGARGALLMLVKRVTKKVHVEKS